MVTTGRRQSVTHQLPRLRSAEHHCGACRRAKLPERQKWRLRRLSRPRRLHARRLPGSPGARAYSGPIEMPGSGGVDWAPTLPKPRSPRYPEAQLGDLLLAATVVHADGSALALMMWRKRMNPNPSPSSQGTQAPLGRSGRV